MTAYLVTGGAGFIGSHVSRRLAEDPSASVVVYDNLTSGRVEHLGDALDEGRVRLVTGDLKDLEPLVAAMEGVDHVFHFAANPDIAKAMAEPSVDFWEGTFLTNNVLEAMRRAGVRRLTYASGSGVYGDVGELPVHEDLPLWPISPYGASKLGCEAMISAYCHMFGIRALMLRFANVVGPNQTHGVAYDFIRRLRDDPAELAILGDGSQSKSYVHVDDVVDALTGLFPEEGPSDAGPERRHRGLPDGARDRRPGGRAARARGRRVPPRRGRPRLEGRRPGRALRQLARPGARVVERAHLARGDGRLDRRDDRPGRGGGGRPWLTGSRPGVVRGAEEVAAHARWGPSFDG